MHMSPATDARAGSTQWEERKNDVDAKKPGRHHEQRMQARRVAWPRDMGWAKLQRRKCAGEFFLVFYLHVLLDFDGGSMANRPPCRLAPSFGLTIYSNRPT